MKISGTCPNCFEDFEELDENILFCPKCHSSFEKGQEVIVSLSDAMRLASRAERRQRASDLSQLKPKNLYIRKKKIPHSTGFFGVSRTKKQKEAWRYYHRASGIQIQSSSLKTLRHRVKEAGGRWEIVYLPSARRSADIDGIKLSELM